MNAEQFFYICCLIDRNGHTDVSEFSDLDVIIDLDPIYSATFVYYIYYDGIMDLCIL